MAFIVLLADRPPQQALPALEELDVDLKLEPLAAVADARPGA